MNTLALEDDLYLVDLALYFEPRRLLAIADLHLGFDEALTHEGLLVPHLQLEAVRERLNSIIAYLAISSAHSLKTLIINGDLRHQFGPLSKRESQEALDLLAELSVLTECIILVQGNHDGDLESLVRNQTGVEFCQAHREGSFLFSHGDRRPARLSPHIRTVIIGHEHPAVGLRDPVTGRVELYKCFLKGCYRGRTLLVQPSFNPLSVGSDLARERCLSPLLDERALPNFEVYPVADDGSIYAFGPLGQLLPAGRASAR
jgi:putative SbcD/Mre11-related phosphoesterase